MILIRVPLRISFLGGGTDLPAFYRTYGGRVISATIDKYIYLVIKPNPLVDAFVVKYQQTESVHHPKDLAHDRVREMLLDLQIVKGGLEIGSFADLPAKTGLGSSSSFSVALVKGLYTYLGKSISKEKIAEEASRLEISLLKEPIGKQDQYAASFGGFNVFEFNRDDSVTVRPIFLDFKKRTLLERHALLFFTGMTRNAGDVLKAQNKTMKEHIETYNAMAKSVTVFEELLMKGDMRGLGRLLLEGWKQKKSLSTAVSNSTVDTLFTAGSSAGAWGGKVLGAGGGGCILFIAPPKHHAHIRKGLRAVASKQHLTDFREIPFSFTQAGADVLFNNEPKS